MKASGTGPTTDRSSREGGADPPLSGTVVVTRPRRKMGTLVEPFEEAGLRVLALPALEVVPPDDPAPLQAAAGRIYTYDWVVLTSPRGVRALAGALRHHGMDPRVWRPRRVAVVGPSTAGAVRDLGWSVALIPSRYSAEGLLAAFREEGEPVAGARVLLPLAEAAADVLPDGLSRAGAAVEHVVAYRSVPPEQAEVDEVREALESEEVDLSTFTSPSTAANFLDLVGPPAVTVPAAVIGPVTGDAARELGYRVVVEAEESTAEGLARAVLGWFSEDRG